MSGPSLGTADARAPGAAARVTLHVPAALVRAMRDAVLRAPDGEQRLRDAGHAAGAAVYDRFAEWLGARGGAAPESTPMDAFGPALAAFTAEQGWGTLAMLAPGADGGPPNDAGGAAVALDACAWFEALAAEPAPYPTCHFTTGLLAGFFGRLADEPLAVLETACAAAGAAECRFLVGAPDVLARVYEARFRP